MREPQPRRLLTAALAALCAVLLTGCIDDGTEMPVPTSPPSSSATPTPEPEPTVEPPPAPDYWPEGTAVQNQRFFDYINELYHANNGMGTAESIVDSLVNSGFDKAAMEVTWNQTAIGLVADSIIVSVRIGDECLIGQFTPEQYVGILADVLGTGKCLVGQTKPIDW